MARSCLVASSCKSSSVKYTPARWRSPRAEGNCQSQLLRGCAKTAKPLRWSRRSNRRMAQSAMALDSATAPLRRHGRVGKPRGYLLFRTGCPFRAALLQLLAERASCTSQRSSGSQCSHQKCSPSKRLVKTWRPAPCSKGGAACSRRRATG